MVEKRFSPWADHEEDAVRKSNHRLLCENKTNSHNRPTDTYSSSCRLLRGSRGSSLSETAIFLALIVGGIWVTAEIAGFAVSKIFSDVSSEIAEAENNNYWFATSATKSRRVATDDFPPSSYYSESIRSRTAAVVRWATFIAALLISIFVWALFYRNNSRRKSVEDLGLSSSGDAEIPLHVNGSVIFKKRQQIFQILSGEMSSLFSSRLIVRYLMTDRIMIISPDKKVEEATRVMEENHLRHLPVCDEKRKLIGILSDRDVIGKRGIKVSEVMTSNPYTVEPDSSIIPAITLMINRQISCLAVIEEGSLCGMLTSTDMMVALQCTIQTLQKVATEVEPEKASEDWRDSEAPEVNQLSGH